MGGSGSGRKKEETPDPTVLGLLELKHTVANLNKHLVDLSTDDIAWWGKLIRYIDKISEFKP
jgi:hypothetical protein